MKKILLGAIALVMGVCMQAQVATVVEPAYEQVNGYILKNLWIKSVPTANYSSFSPDEVRGMDVLNGKLLFGKRTDHGETASPRYTKSILIYDGLTGAFEKELTLDQAVFRKTDDSEVFGPCNDLHVDAGGNVLVGNLALSLQTTGNFQVWKIDMETGAGTKVLDCLLTGFEPTSAFRVDAFGVYGDITTGKAYLMAAVAGDVAGIGDVVLRWDYQDGQLVEGPTGPTNFIQITEYYPTSTPTNGTAPRVCPVDADYFYLDGFNSYATMYDMEGQMVESFKLATDLQPTQAGNNGVDEFSINGRNFVVYNYSNTLATPPQTWNLCELGAGMSFNGMTKFYNFPQLGMGITSNAVRTAIPCIEVDEAGKVATIYTYAYAGGYAAYQFGAVEDLTSIKTVTDGYALTIVATANGIKLSEAADVEVYNLTGQRVLVQSNATEVGLQPGLYVVKAIVEQGKVGTAKVVIR